MYEYEIAGDFFSLTYTLQYTLFMYLRHLLPVKKIHNIFQLYIYIYCRLMNFLKVFMEKSLLAFAFKCYLF
jgi:hypothetical protein